MNEKQREMIQQYADHDGQVTLTKQEVYDLLTSERTAWELVELARQKLNYIATIAKREWKMDDPLALAQIALDEIDEEIKTFQAIRD